MPSGLPLERAARLKVEEERLRALPSFKFELLDFNHHGQAHGVILDEDRRHPIQIEFDATFPFRRPTLRSEDDNTKALRHVNRAGEICILRSQPDDWDPEALTAADLVELTWKLIVNKGDLDASEDDAIPEPVDFHQERWSTLLLVPEDAKCDTSTHGAALLRTSPVPTSRVLLRELKDANGNPVWSLPEATVQQYLPRPSPKDERLPWFHTSEPPPYSLASVEDLERIMPAGLNLQALLTTTRAGTSIARKEHGVIRILIHYEDETGSRWAFVEVPMLRGRSGNLRPAGAPHYLKPFTVGNDAFFGRIDGLLDRERLQEAHVVLIGVGAIGSRLAALLNQSGVGRVTAFDGDAVAPGNPVRGQLPFAHIGLGKVHSVGVALREHLPTTQFRGVPFRTSHPEGRTELDRVLREDQVDLCVVAIGHHNDSRYLDRILAPFATPRIYTWTTRGAAAGVVLTVHPRASGPTLTSYDDYHQREYNHEFPDLPEESEAHVPNVIERGCAAPALPATPLDIATVALNASQTTIDLLLNRPVAPYQYWTRQDRAWISISFDDPITPHQQPRVGEPNRVREVLLSSSAIETMKRHANASPGEETGGILVGRLEATTLRIEFAAGPGEHSRRTWNRLVLDQRYAQGCIDAVASMSNGQLRYTGEWHTHVSGDLTPSTVDRRSLRTLATSPEAAIDTPVILVVGRGLDGDLELRAFTLIEDTITELKINQATSRESARFALGNTELTEA